MSIHFYDDDLNLKSAFIACEPFEGRHTKDRVGQKLRSMFEQFGILEKVFFVTTDGAGEYVVAMQLYGDNNRTIQALTDQNHVDWLHRNAGSDTATTSGANDELSTSTDSCSRNEIDDDIDSEREQFDEHDFSRIDYNHDQNEANLDHFVVHDFIDDDDNEPLLGKMNRIACSSHRLEKIGRIDALNANTDPQYKEMHDRVFKVLNQIWNEKDSRLNAEIFFKITGRRLIGPHRIRWTKTYDAVSDVFFFLLLCFLKVFFVPCIFSFNLN